MSAPDDYLLMSGIQHFCFCRRQWALIHLEQQWSENLRTAEGPAAMTPRRPSGGAICSSHEG